MYLHDNTTNKIAVTGIDWERVFLKLTITSEFDEDISFKLRWFDRFTLDKKADAADIQMVLEPGKEIPLVPVTAENNVYTFVLNIAALDGRNFLDNGKWQIQAVVGDTEYTCSVSYDVAYQEDALSRVFRYGGGKYAYNISFSTYSEDEKTLSFILNSHFMIENKKWKKRKYVKEANTLPGKFNRFYKFVVIEGIKGYYQIAEHLSPKHGDKILFMTETKDYLWGNLMYIDNRLKERGLDKKFKISYSCRKSVGQHKSALSWAKLVTQIAHQDYIFVDDYVPVFGFLNLNKRTKLIQVWHAGEGFKAVGYCRFGKSGTPFPVGSCHKKYDYVITGSKKLVHVFAEVFGIEESAFLPLGMARLDGFLDPGTIDKFRSEFYDEHPEMKGKKIILFAPTYRGTGQKTAYYDYDRLDLKQIYDFCGDEYIFMFKMHPFVQAPPEIPDAYKDRIVDFSYYENINDLYYVTDLLITDYSSNYFEYALMRKPVLFFTYDRETYELIRGVHRPVKESAPGKVCDTFDEMMDALKSGDFEKEKIDKFVEENFGDYDGKAADKAIDAILLQDKNSDGRH